MTKFTNTALFFLGSLSSVGAFSAVPKTGQRLVPIVVASSCNYCCSLVGVYHSCINPAGDLGALSCSLSKGY